MAERYGKDLVLFAAIEREVATMDDDKVYTVKIDDVLIGGLGAGRSLENSISEGAHKLTFIVDGKERRSVDFTVTKDKSLFQISSRTSIPADFPPLKRCSSLKSAKDSCGFAPPVPFGYDRRKIRSKIRTRRDFRQARRKTGEDISLFYGAAASADEPERPAGEGK